MAKLEPQRVARSVHKTRVTVAGSLLALVGAVVALFAGLADAKESLSGFAVAVIFILIGQIAARSYLVLAEQEDLVESAGNAQMVLASIQQGMRAELRLEQQQSLQLTSLLSALKECELLSVHSLEALEEHRPATRYYLRTQADAIIDILGGTWDRSEYLRPSQLWHEYEYLIGQMVAGGVFRSTVCVPHDPELLFGDASFASYLQAIYQSARERGVRVRRLYVLECKQLPQGTQDLHPALAEHLDELRGVEAQVAEFEVRMATFGAAKTAFHEHPDFMIWGEGLLVESDLSGEDGLVAKAKFHFAGTKSQTTASELIAKRTQEFDRLFDDRRTAQLPQLSA